MESPKRQQTSSSSPSSSVLGLVLLHSKCCLGDCLSHVTVKVLLLWRIFFSLVGYLQSVLLLWRMNFFLSCGLPTFQWFVFRDFNSLQSDTQMLGAWTTWLLMPCELHIFCWSLIFQNVIDCWVF
jgi:hypothetical protein